MNEYGTHSERALCAYLPQPDGASPRGDDGAECWGDEYSLGRLLHVRATLPETASGEKVQRSRQ